MYPRAYIHFLVHFHSDRDYFECHEILEEYWKESDDRDKNSIWVGFILLAVAAYHHRRSNYNGAMRTLGKAIKIFGLKEDRIEILGIDKQMMFPLLNNQLAAIKKEENYQSYCLPIADSSLLKECLTLCQQKGLIWNQRSNTEDFSLVHRHKLRDRSIVIQERFAALELKKGNE